MLSLLRTWAPPLSDCRRVFQGLIIDPVDFLDQCRPMPRGDPALVPFARRVFAHARDPAHLGQSDAVDNLSSVQFQLHESKARDLISHFQEEISRDPSPKLCKSRPQARCA